MKLQTRFDLHISEAKEYANGDLRHQWDLVGNTWKQYE